MFCQSPIYFSPHRIQNNMRPLHPCQFCSRNKITIARNEYNFICLFLKSTIKKFPLFFEILPKYSPLDLGLKKEKHSFLSSRKQSVKPLLKLFSSAGSKSKITSPEEVFSKFKLSIKITIMYQELIVFSVIIPTSSIVHLAKSI